MQEITWAEQLRLIRQGRHYRFGKQASLGVPAQICR